LSARYDHISLGKTGDIFIQLKSQSWLLDASKQQGVIEFFFDMQIVNEPRTFFLKSLIQLEIMLL